MNFVKSNQKVKYYEKKVSKDYFIIEKNIIFAGTHIILDLWNCSFSNKITPLNGGTHFPMGRRDNNFVILAAKVPAINKGII